MNTESQLRCTLFLKNFVELIHTNAPNSQQSFAYSKSTIESLKEGEICLKLTTKTRTTFALTEKKKERRVQL